MSIFCTFFVCGKFIFCSAQNYEKVVPLSSIFHNFLCFFYNYFIRSYFTMAYKGKKVADYLSNAVKKKFGTQKKAASILGDDSGNFSYKLRNASDQFINQLVSLGVDISFNTLMKLDESGKFDNIIKVNSISNSGENDMQFQGNGNYVHVKEESTPYQTMKDIGALEHRLKIMENEVIEIKKILISKFGLSDIL